MRFNHRVLILVVVALVVTCCMFKINSIQKVGKATGLKNRSSHLVDRDHVPRHLNEREKEEPENDLGLAQQNFINQVLGSDQEELDEEEDANELVDSNGQRIPPTKDKDQKIINESNNANEAVSNLINEDHIEERKQNSGTSEGKTAAKPKVKYSHQAKAAAVDSGAHYAYAKTEPEEDVDDEDYEKFDDNDNDDDFEEDDDYHDVEEVHYQQHRHQSKKKISGKTNNKKVDKSNKL